MSAGIGIGGILAVLSKENGILLPLYVLVIEYTLLRTMPKPAKWKIWSSFFLWLPLFMLAIYLITKYEDMELTALTTRDFTLGERLLTETRVLTDYIGKILLPRPQEFGLFHDDFSISRSLINPMGTLYSAVALISLFIIAIFYRLKHPVLSFSILWFFAGHILESSYIPLELYFEHRNYLPSAGILFAAVYYTIYAFKKIKRDSIRTTAAISVFFLLVTITLITWQESKLWGNPLRQAYTWANEHPLSRRAQAQLGHNLRSIGEIEKSIAVFTSMTETFPYDPTPLLLVLKFACNNEKVKPPSYEKLINRLTIAKASLAPIGQLDQIIESHQQGLCPEISSQKLISMVNVLIANKNYIHQQDDLYTLRARLYLSENKYEPAINDLEAALNIKSTVERLINLTRLAVFLKNHEYALHYLNKAKADNIANPLTYRLNAKNIMQLEKQIREELNMGASD